MQGESASGYLAAGREILDGFGGQRLTGVAGAWGAKVAIDVRGPAVRPSRAGCAFASICLGSTSAHPLAAAISPASSQTLAWLFLVAITVFVQSSEFVLPRRGAHCAGARAVQAPNWRGAGANYSCGGAF